MISPCPHLFSFNHRQSLGDISTEVFKQETDWLNTLHKLHKDIS
jgi:hypothetical protein